MGGSQYFWGTQWRIQLIIFSPLFLLVLSACQSVPPSLAPVVATPTAAEFFTPTTTFTPTLCPNPNDPYPPPGCGPTATDVLSYPGPYPGSTATLLPTLTPTPPMIIPPAASFTPSPAVQTLANLLPAHSQYMSGVVADLGPGGSPAVAAVSYGPIGMVGDTPEISQAVLRLSIQPLTNAALTLPAPDPMSVVQAEVLDLDKDGKRELVLRPSWKGSLIFQSTGLGSWPRLMDENGDIKFNGGRPEFGLQENDGYLDFNHLLRSELYYAGLKQAVIDDVDGDGFYEVDVAYAETDGADVWQVLRYRWQDGEYRYTGENDTRPAEEAVPPEQFLRWRKALEPLPEVILGGKGDGPGPLTVRAVQVSRLDINHDGQEESLLVYRVTSSYQPMYYYPTGAMALAVFAPDDTLVWRSDYKIFSSANLEVSAEPVELSASEMGFIYQWITLCPGDPMACDGHVTLFRWNGYSILPVWERQIATQAYGERGYDNRHSEDAVWLEDIDHDGRQEILQQSQVSLQNSQDGLANYWLNLPGTRVYKWNGASYALAYLVHNGLLERIRPSLPVVYAPFLSQSRPLDWQWPNIRQLEYGRMPFASSLLDQPGIPDMLFAWDLENLYLYFASGQTSSTRIAFDTDLDEDYNDSSMNSDDFLLHIAANQAVGPMVYITNIRTGEQITGFYYSIGCSDPCTAGACPGNCTVELAIPLKFLGLDGTDHLSHPGWLTYGLKNQWHYLPAVERVIGFSAWQGKSAFAYLLQDDPTTWGTLVFMSDR